jgi:arsenate reductase
LGCADAVPARPGKRYEDWILADPAGRDIDSLRPMRDQIRERVEVLIASLV